MSTFKIGEGYVDETPVDTAPVQPAFRTKPSFVSAVQFLRVDHGLQIVFDAAEVPEWLLDALSEPSGEAGSVALDWVASEKPVLKVSAIGARFIASPGDWIVRRPNGQFFVFSDALFKAMYEPAA